jgi:purine-binding chemotaxis protein CheW
MSIYDRFSEKELEILRARANRIVTTSRDDQARDVITALVISAGRETYAMPIDQLTAVYENIAVAPVPCVPSFVAGIANIRGHILPVLDLAVLLNVPREDTERRALIVVSDSDSSVALAVEAVGEVTTFLKQDLTSIPGAYLQGVMQDGVAVLDVAAILGDPALVVDETAI